MPESERLRDGLFALLLALKKKPAIRFQKSSKDAERIAGLLSQHIEQHQDVMDFTPAKGGDSPPLLLILDRFDDPVTPLLNQWTYQAMIHELLGIRNNIVELPGEPPGGKGGGRGSDPQQIVFSTETDDFYRDNLFTDYGQIHDRLVHALDAFKQANPALRAAEDGRDAAAAPAFQTVAEMQRFVERFPEMSKLKDCVARHVNLLHALSRRIEREGVMEASELEQQLACVHDYRAALRQVTAMLDGAAAVPDLAKLRLVLLLALRYQKEAAADLPALLKRLPPSLRPDDLGLPHTHTLPQLLLQACGRDARTPGADLFNRGVAAAVRSGLRSLAPLAGAGASGAAGAAGAGGAGGDNAYMLHEPLLARVLRDLDRGRLPEEGHPYRDGGALRAPAEALRALRRGPAEAVVFVVGGATYAEARVVARWNEANRHQRTLLGGTAFLGSAAFLQSLAARAAAPPPPPAAAAEPGAGP
jgi:vacuolar protein sorting-associated protein 45